MSKSNRNFMQRPYYREKPGKGESVMFHQFPSDEVIRKKWIDSITKSCGFKNELKAIVDKSCVCSDHFNESDYTMGFTGTKRLDYKCAIPLTTPTRCEVRKRKFIL
jgi:hypothetical protein